jgi:hypothetical protein
MGPGREAVVDAGLRVRGVEGVRIADASVMPTIPSANTHAAAATGDGSARALVEASPSGFAFAGSGPRHGLGLETKASCNRGGAIHELGQGAPWRAAGQVERHRKRRRNRPG